MTETSGGRCRIGKLLHRSRSDGRIGAAIEAAAGAPGGCRRSGRCPECAAARLEGTTGLLLGLAPSSTGGDRKAMPPSRRTSSSAT